MTITRAYRETIADMQKTLPGVRQADIISMAWSNYKAVNKAGRFIYGNAWKQPKKTK